MNKLKQYLSEIFQDVDGYYSMKRAAFAMLVITLCGVVWYVAVHRITLPDSVFYALKDSVAVLAGAIAGEHISKFAAGAKMFMKPDCQPDGSAAAPGEGS